MEAFQEIQALPTLKDVRDAKRIPVEGVAVKREKSQEMKDLGRQIQITNRSTTKALKTFKQDLRLLKKMSKSLIKNFKGDKGKFLNIISNIETQKQFDSAYPQIIERVKMLESQQDVRTLKGTIEKQLKTTKLKRGGKYPSGKFDSGTQKVFNSLQKLNRMTVDTFNEGVETLDRSNPIEQLTYEIAVGMRSGNPTQMQEAVDTINYLKGYGKNKNAERILQRASDTQQMVDTAINIMGKPSQEALSGNYPTPSRRLKISNILGELKQHTLNSFDENFGIVDMFDKKSEYSDGSFLAKADVHLNGVQVSVLRDTWTQTIRLKMKELGWNINSKLKEDSVKKNLTSEGLGKSGTVIKEYVDKDGNITEKEVPLSITKSETRKLWMEMQDKTNDQRFIDMGVGENIRQAVDKSLSKEDKSFIEFQFKFYKDILGKVNPIYRVMEGVELEDRAKYSPVRTEGVEQRYDFSDFLSDARQRATIKQGFMREKTSTNAIALQSDIDAMFNQVMQASKYVAYAEKLNTLQNTVNNKEFQARLKELLGSRRGGSAIAAMNYEISDIKDEGRGEGAKIPPLDYLRKGYFIATLASKPKIVATQLASFINFTEKMPAGAFIGEMANTLTHIPTAHKFFKKNVDWYRLRGSNIDIEMKRLAKSDSVTTFLKNPTLENYLMSMIKFGDKGAILLGGYGYYNWQIKNGVSKEDALKAFSKTASKAQQSGARTDLPKPMRSNNSLAKALTMYLTTTTQHLQKVTGYAHSLATGKGTILRNVKGIFLYHVLQGVIYQTISNLAWDDEDKLTDHLLRSALLGSLNAVPLIGTMLENMYDVAKGEKPWRKAVPFMSIPDDIATAMSKYKQLKDKKKRRTAEEKEKLMWDIAENVADAAAPFLHLPTGTWVKQIEGVNDLSKGNIAGAFKVGGWSTSLADKRAKQISKKKPAKKELDFTGGLDAGGLDFSGGTDTSTLDFSGGADVTGLDFSGGA